MFAVTNVRDLSYWLIEDNENLGIIFYKFLVHCFCVLYHFVETYFLLWPNDLILPIVSPLLLFRNGFLETKKSFFLSLC